MRVVLDTNVLISATLFEGSEAQKLVNELVGCGAEIYCSEEMLSEYAEAIERDFVAEKKLEVTKERLPSLVADIRRLAVFVDADAGIRASRDPKDDKIIGCALAGGCGYLVTYDADLLDLKEFGKVRIVKPAGMRRIIAEQRR
jgi:putative PIN family toxin of toxin-antitoxin system